MMAAYPGIIRQALATLLASAAASIAFYLWIVDPVALQREFGAMLGAELVIFSMIVYVFYKHPLTKSNINWLLLGCVTATLFLVIAVFLGSLS